ncbi:MAG: NmrA/HSCARG family protein [Armatimonadota bacterium]
MDVRLGPVLVTGATGRQGGMVANRLLQRGLPVRIFVRDGAAPQARRLHELGAELAVGNMNNAENLRTAMFGVAGVYSMQSWEDGVDVEIREGIAVADTAQAMKVDFVVYSSAAGADRDTGVPHFDSKFVIETHILDLHLKAAILRPVYFMENFLQPEFLSGMERGVLRFPLPPDRPLQVVAISDIGEFAAEAFEHPREYTGKTFELAGDELTPAEIARLWGRKLGHEVRYEQMPLQEYARGEPEGALMFEWLERVGYDAPIESLRLLHPEMLNFEQWLNTVSVPQAAPV